MVGWPKWPLEGKQLKNRCSLQQFSIETKSKTSGKDGAVHPTSMFMQQPMVKIIQGYKKGILKSMTQQLSYQLCISPAVSERCCSREPTTAMTTFSFRHRTRIRACRLPAREGSLGVKRWPGAITHQTSISLALTLYRSLTWCQRDGASQPLHAYSRPGSLQHHVPPLMSARNKETHFCCYGNVKVFKGTISRHLRRQFFFLFSLQPSFQETRRNTTQFFLKGNKLLCSFIFKNQQ